MPLDNTYKMCFNPVELLIKRVGGAYAEKDKKTTGKT